MRELYRDGYLQTMKWLTREQVEEARARKRMVEGFAQGDQSSEPKE